MPKFIRTRYLINKKMQLRYALMIGLVLIVMIIIVEYHTYLTISSILPHILSSTVANELKRIHFYLLINGLIYTVIVVVISIFISHKFAGPVYRLKKEIREMIETGNIDKKIALRKGDELKDLVEVFNELIEKIKVKNVNQKMQ